MNYSDFITKINSNFNDFEQVTISGIDTRILYEERFEVKWLATKLKIFSYIAYLPNVGKQEIFSYSEACLAKSLDCYRGLPRGLNNGVASFNLLAAGNVDIEAALFAQARPKKHFAAFEMPVIFDLTNEKFYYYKETPMWGAIYYKFFREFIEENFRVN